MKRILNLCFLSLIFLGLTTAISAQCENHDKHHKSNGTAWDEAKEAFHGVMAATFHPAEEGDIMPVKEKSKELVSLSKAWKKVDIPEDLSKEDLKPLIKKLYAQSTKIDKMVDEGASDDDLKKAIYALHDVFHDVVGKCQEHE